MTSANATDPGQNVLRALHEHATRLAGELPGRLGRLSVRSGDVTIDIEWSAAHATGGSLDGPAGAPRAANLDADDGSTQPRARVATVTSPIVGTFYRAPEPGARPFVEVGDVIEAGQPIGIVEAMKLLNPVAADAGGTVVRVLVDNGEPVEFGQALVEVAAGDAHPAIED